MINIETFREGINKMDKFELFQKLMTKALGIAARVAPRGKERGVFLFKTPPGGTRGSLG